MKDASEYKNKVAQFLTRSAPSVQSMEQIEASLNPQERVALGQAVDALVLRSQAAESRPGIAGAGLGAIASAVGLASGSGGPNTPQNIRAAVEGWDNETKAAAYYGPAEKMFTQALGEKGSVYYRSLMQMASGQTRQESGAAIKADEITKNLKAFAPSSVTGTAGHAQIVNDRRLLLKSYRGIIGDQQPLYFEQ